MTALAGLWRFDGAPNASHDCARMLSAQGLYGLHGTADWSADGIALGRNLMKVLPEDVFDQQPLIGRSGTSVLVADVRLDNRDELFYALDIGRCEGSSLCDAAVLLAAIERWGEACFDRLVGDYAFALWDRIRRRLLLARDPLGHRPLHYHRGNKFFAFASMPKGLLALPQVSAAPDEQRIRELLVSLTEDGPRTFFRDIERVESGHFLIVTRDSIVSQRHWQPSGRRIRLRRSQDYSEALRSHLDVAVRSQLRGSGDVGVYMSGGLDSTAVAATAARLLAPSSRSVVAYTAVPREGYDGPALPHHIIDEGSLAAATAALYSNMEHVLVRSDGGSPLDDLDRFVSFFDQPIFNLCNFVWWSRISDTMRQRNIRIALGGDAGNLGFSYAGDELLPELLRNGRWFRWWREATALRVKRGKRWRGIVSSTFGPWCPAGLWIWLHKVVAGRTLSIGNHSAIHPDQHSKLDLSALAKSGRLYVASPPWSQGFAKRLWSLRVIDPGNYWKGLLGGWQLDYRDPTADRRLMEFCLSVPTEEYLRQGVRRALARSALADRLPKCVLEEQRTGLQAADWHERLSTSRSRIVRELDLLESCEVAAQLIDLTRLRGLVSNWPAGGWEQNDISNPYRLILLNAISTGHFLRHASAQTQ